MNTKCLGLGFFILLSTTVASSSDPNPLVPAFPGAEGYGAVSIGGRGGRVIEVTSLADSGSGTLREALEAFGPRTVVFRVGGVITLSTSIYVQNPFVTVAGQTAPGDGITLRFQSGGRGALIYVRTHDVILRYLKLRRGDTGYHGDGLSILNPSENVIVDHCTITWATDENFEIYTVDPVPIRNITIQRTLIAEALNEVTGTTAGHPLGGLISGVQETDLWKLVQNVDIHKSVFAHNIHRNPRVIAKGAKVVGNIMYNWDTRVGETSKSTQVDWIANYFKHGPMSDMTLLFHESTDYTGTVVYEDPSIYIENNIAPALTQFRNPSADNWYMIVDHYLVGRPTLPLRMRRTTPLSEAVFPISYEIPSSTQFANVLDEVGANQRLSCAGGLISSRDGVDTRIIRDVELGTGPTRSQLLATADAAGGYSTAISSNPCADTDHDGMPDEWEMSVGLNPQWPDDRNQDYDGDGYTNLEKYLNRTTTIQSFVLTVHKTGNGFGSVVSSPSGIDCGNDCAEVLGEGSAISLTAIPSPGSEFAGWSGGGCGVSDVCTVTLNASITVSAVFNLVKYPLNVLVSGTGGGSVSSSPAGISCGSDCSEVYTRGTSLTLSAVPVSASEFLSWSGDACAGSTALTCILTMSAPKQVVATFKLKAVVTYLLKTTVVKGAGAGGKLVSTPQGINCGSDCQEPYAEKSHISLKAVPDDYSYLSSWSGGGCSGSLSSCTVYMDTNKTVQGSFTHGSYYLTAKTEGTGSGGITSSPQGISCGAGQTDCLQWYKTNTIVTLTVTAAAGSTFAGWTTGGCQYAATKMLPTCKVTLNRNILVKADFTKN